MHNTHKICGCIVVHSNWTQVSTGKTDVQSKKLHLNDVLLLPMQESYGNDGFAEPQLM